MPFKRLLKYKLVHRSTKTSLCSHSDSGPTCATLSLYIQALPTSPPPLQSRVYSFCPLAFSQTMLFVNIH